MSKPVKCVVVPAKPPMDKLFAYKRVQLDDQGRHELRIAFCDVNVPDAGRFAAWQAMCSAGVEPYYIDIDRKKYHGRAGSAAELELMLSETKESRIYNRLVEMANRNNKTGFLKQARHAVPKIIRDAYDIMGGGVEWQEQVFFRGIDVVNAFFLPQNKREWNSLFTAAEHSELRKLWEGFNVTEDEILPFTLPLYFKQLFCAGRSAGEIAEKIGWWLDKVERIGRRRNDAREKVYDVRKFYMPLKIGGKPKPGGLVRVNGYFEGEAFIYDRMGSGELAVAIIRNDRKQVVIQSSMRHRGADFAALAAELERLEPGRWYYERRFASGPILMNGSRQFTGVPPTSLSDDELIRLTYTLAAFRMR